MATRKRDYPGRENRDLKWSLVPFPPLSEESPAEEEEPIREIQSQLQRYADHQVSVRAEMDSKLGQLLSLSVVALGGGIALGRLILGNSGNPLASTEIWGLGGVVGGAILNLIASLIFLDLYVGLSSKRSPEVFPGPDPAWYIDRVHEDDWEPRQVRSSLTKAYRTTIDENEDEINRLARRRRVGVWAALLGVVLYGATILLLGLA